MAFTDFSFLLLVLLAVVVYYVAPRRMRWVVLLAASMAFYWLNSGMLLLVLLATVAVTYGIGRWIEHSNACGKQEVEELGKHATRAEKKEIRARTKMRSRKILIAGVALDLGALLFLKYFNFFADGVQGVLGIFGLSVVHLDLLLPLGISFYTLQAIAYMTDVYRGKVSAEHNVLHFTLYMSFFPQIVQGPIARFNQLSKQLVEPHDFDYTRLCHGAQLVVWGLFQKLVIADRIAIPVNQVFNNWGDYHGIVLFLAAAGYGLQVYTDFNGGMDIARGVAQMLGIKLELNFKQPYFSTSVEDFWRRWHITLGKWMKDYVFYPLSLSKAFVGLGRKSRKVLGDFVGKRMAPILAMFIVYFLVGFWHGPSWKYIAYGVWNGLFLVAGILLPEQYERWASALHVDRTSFSWRCFQIVRTFVICTLGRVFSRGYSLKVSLGIFGSIFGEWNNFSSLAPGAWGTLGLDERNWFLLVLAVLVLFLVDRCHEHGLHIREAIDRQMLPIRWLTYLLAVLVIVVFGIWGSAYDASGFIYGKF